MFCQFIIVNRKRNTFRKEKKLSRVYENLFKKKKLFFVHFFEITSFDIYKFWFEPHFYLFETFLNHCTVYMYCILNWSLLIFQIQLSFQVILIIPFPNEIINYTKIYLSPLLFITKRKHLDILISNKSDNFKKVILSQYMRCTSRFEFFDGGTNNKSCNQS